MIAGQWSTQLCIFLNWPSVLPYCRTVVITTSMLTATPWQLTLHHMSPSSQELYMVSLTDLTACLPLTSSIYLHVFFQPIAPSPAHRQINRVEIACKSLLPMGFEPRISTCKTGMLTTTPRQLTLHLTFFFAAANMHVITRSLKALGRMARAWSGVGGREASHFSISAVLWACKNRNSSHQVNMWYADILLKLGCLHAHVFDSFFTRI